MKKPPCIGCEFEKLDKGRPECRNCDARLAHAATIELSGAAIHSSRMVRPSVVSAITKEPEIKETHMEKTRICSNCGHPKLLTEDNFHKHPGCSDGYEGQCKECRKIKRGINSPGRKPGRPKKNSLVAEPVPASGPGSVKPDAEDQITLDFSKHHHLLASLKVMADKHFRPVEQQIMWLIDCAAQAEGEV